MAAATVASTDRPRVLGDLKMLIVSFTGVADTNTYTVPGGSGVRVLGACILKCSTKTASQIGVSVSGQTITFAITAGGGGNPDLTIGVIIG